MPQPFQPEDLLLHRRISDVHGIAAHSKVLFTVNSIDREQDRYQSHIWLYDPSDGQARPLTSGPALDSSARWAPDGRSLAFVSTRSGKPRLYRLGPEGGEPKPVGSESDTVASFQWLPDGRRFLVAARVEVDPELRGRRGPAAKPGGAKVELVWRLPYKEDGVGYLLDREIHLFEVDAETGQRRQIDDGPRDVMASDASPDGERVAFSRTRQGRFAHRTDLWVSHLDGHLMRQLTHDHAMVMQPVWSPDCMHIAFTGSREDGDSQVNLWVVSMRTGDCRLVGSCDVEVADPTSVRWTDEQHIVYVAALKGRHEVVRVDVESGRMESLLARDWHISSFSMTADSMVFSADRLTGPSELHCCDANGSNVRTLSDFNPWWRERTPLQAVAREFDVPDGRGGHERIMGWLLGAVDQAKPAPLMNDMHGGPASYALLDYDSQAAWPVLCSQGWSILALNAVGSGSFGRSFCSRLSGHWGELDYPQHQAALEQLKREGTASDCLAVSGKSYGGYLSAWAIGHSDIFGAAVVMAPVGNIETHYGTSDGGYYAEPLYMDTAPRFDRELARRLSPLQHIEKAKTPTLFLQGKEDERCPKCQSEELFVSLMKAGETPAEMALYPGENHHFLGSGTPSCRIDAVSRIVGWLQQWCSQPK